VPVDRTSLLHAPCRTPVQQQQQQQHSTAPINLPQLLKHSSMHAGIHWCLLHVPPRRYCSWGSVLALLTA
jgi:hypothetical protein